MQVPGPITNVYFTAASATGNVAGSLTTTLDGAYPINGLTFAVTPGTITSVAINTAGNTLTIGSGGLTLTSTSNAGASINGSGGVIVNGSQTWANNSSLPLAVNVPISAYSGPTTLTVSGSGGGGAALGGVISNGGGSLSLVLNQAGTVTLGGSAANTYSGGTTISSGLVRLIGALALGNTAGSLTANGGTLDLNGNPVTANGGFNGAAGTIYNNAGSGIATLTVGNGGSFSGNIADNGGVSGGSVALVFTGSGALALSGTNTYSGGTTVSGGTLDINSNSAVGSGTLSLAGGNINNTSGQPVTLGNVSQVWASNFSFGGSNFLNLGNGPVTMSNNVTATVSGSTLEVDGTINGNSKTMTLNTTGSGVLLLAGSVGNIGGGNNEWGNVTLTGTATAGTVLFLGFAGGSTAITGTTTIATGGVLDLVASNTNLPISNYVVVNGGTIQNVSAGTLDIVGIGWSGNQAGTLTINSGLLNLAGVTVQFGHTGTAKGSFLNLDGGTCILSTEPTLGDSTGTLNFSGGTLQLNGNITTFAPAGLTLNVGNGGAIINLNGYSTTLSSSNSLLNSGGTSTGGLTVYSTSTGTLTLSAANLYAGNTTINGGIVDPANGAAFSSGTVTVNPGSQIDCTTAQTIANTLVLSGTGANGAALEQGGGQATTYSGPVSLAGNTTIHTDSNASLTLAGNVTLNGKTLTINGDGASSTTFSGNIAADSGALVCNAPGLTLGGSNGYTGGTTVIGGSLIQGSSAALGPGALAVNGGLLNMNGYGATVTSFSGGAAGEVTNGSATPAMLTVTQSNATTFSGSLRDGSSQFGLVLDGTGSLTLTGTNTYSGGTYVEDGALILASNEAIAGGTSLDVGSNLSALGISVPADAGQPTAVATVAPVPEPGTLVLLAAAGTLLLLPRRRR